MFQGNKYHTAWFWDSGQQIWQNIFIILWILIFY